MTDEFVCDTPRVRRFIGQVQTIVARHAAVGDRLAAIRPVFDAAMADPDWLPEEYRRTCETGGMGKGIANWLLYRDTTGCLSLSALVLPPGAATPVHDHLAYEVTGELDGAILHEGQRWGYYGTHDVTDGALEGKPVIPHHLQQVQELWARGVT